MNPPRQLIDTLGRVHTDLRISVTDRCNLRCFYCMPADGVEFKPHGSILSFEEIERFVRVAAGLGIGGVRLTGGEPLVRRGVCDLVGTLAELPGIADLAMTTNAILLSDYAQGLKAAGLDRINVSLDTLDRRKFQRIARRDELPRVLEGIEAARRAGFTNIKLNALAIRDQIEEDVVPLARFAQDRGFPLRFIEFMPLDGDAQWSRRQVLTGEEILDILSREMGPLEPIDPPGARAPATRYRFVGRDGPPIGVIGSVTRPFCDRCGRLRLTADGKVRNCLFATEEWDVRQSIRGGADDQSLADLICRAVRAKKEAHGTDDGRFAKSRRTMHQIGG